MYKSNVLNAWRMAWKITFCFIVLQVKSLFFGKLLSPQRREVRKEKILKQYQKKQHIHLSHDSISLTLRSLRLIFIYLSRQALCSMQD